MIIIINLVFWHTPVLHAARTCHVTFVVLPSVFFLANKSNMVLIEEIFVNVRYCNEFLVR